MFSASRPIKRKLFLKLIKKIFKLTKTFIFFNFIQKSFRIFCPLHRNIRTAHKFIKMLNQIIYHHFSLPD
ncbi:hypothetical protein F469_04852 [Pseudomonas sp. URMO17WK12:I2]|nr:hypothetical protein F469_04852 [Pseudomonas sp. URMO17WK12:I2]